MQKCKRCAHDLAPGALVCEWCHLLAHAEELEQLVAGAKSFEELGNLQQAREYFAKALELLPPGASQADWVRQQVQRLEMAANAPPVETGTWARRLGPLAPVALALWKGKALLSIFKMNFLVSLGAFIWFYWTLFGMKFGLGFAVQILIHEMGHYIDIKRRGLPADMPVFLPGLGAYVRWQALGVSNETRAAVSLAGPLAGLFAALTCAAIWWTTGNTIWAALAHAGAWLNALNLIPVWALDGRQAASVLDKSGRWLLLTICLVLWLVLGQSVFFLVAGGTVYRLFTKDMAGQPSRPIAAYFAALLVALGVLMWSLPGENLGTP